MVPALLPASPRARGRHRRRDPHTGVVVTGVFAVVASTAGVELSMASASAASSDDFAALRRCESGGNYAINTGNGYYGAYQFDIGTWRSLGYPGLPSQAPASVQDEAARRLQAMRGWSPWPACSRRLGLYGERASRSTARAPLPRPTATLTKASTGHARPFAGTLLRVSMVGQKRADVRAWQEQMVRRGWHLTVDGQYGAESAAVCTAFERAMGLHVESPGVVGPQVWRAAFSSERG